MREERRKVAMYEHKILMGEWKTGEEMRKAWNITRHGEWEKEVQMWKDAPKLRGKWPLFGKVKKADPKPTRPSNVVADEDEVSLARGNF